VTLKFGKPASEGTRTVVPTRESWEYSYLSIDNLRSLSPTYTVSYDTTYTLVSPMRGVWIVDTVEAKPLGEVK
jgi:hypothetical protein